MPQEKNDLRGIRRFACWAIAAGCLSLSVLPAADLPGDELTWDFREKLFRPVEDWIKKLENSENADGLKNKEATLSEVPRKIDDATYVVTVNSRTAEEFEQRTERYELTVKDEGGGWAIAGEEVVDTYVGLYRENGMRCYPFAKFSLEREGLTLSAADGTVCESFLRGGVSAFGLHADTMSHSYSPPEHASQLAVGRDYPALHRFMKTEHMKEIDFQPASFLFECDARSCEGLIESSFEGLTRIPREERDAVRYDKGDPNVPAWAQKLIRDIVSNRRDLPFADFRVLDQPGHSHYFVFVTRDLDMQSGVFLSRDNWSGWEVQAGVMPERFDIPNQLIGPVFGYYTKETLETQDPYEIESRPDAASRWFEVYSLKGRVDLGVEDPEMLKADIEFGLTLRQDVKDLPFYIISNQSRGAFGGNRPAPLIVNSIQIGGEEMTWIRTGPTSGRVILPEERKAGTKLELRIDFSTRAIIKQDHSYSYVNRTGWMPFVRFGDMIDEFELTIRSPSQYAIYGDGHKVSESVEGEVRISRWTAEFPVNFPTIIFGKYRTDKAQFDAFKADGTTVIPIHVSVDEASLSNPDLNIRDGMLRSIAEQAANAVNLYTAISGVGYPFGELNLVNDPTAFLEGQAPGAIIYLGSGVFMSDGALAPVFDDASSISRFKRSVVAHEVGHKWWGATISHANDRNRWYRESLAEYFSALYLEFAFGYKDYLAQVDEWRRNLLQTNLKANVQSAQTLFAGEWGGGVAKDATTAAVYDKGPYAFHMLRETFRDPTIEQRGPEGADRRFFTFLKLFTRELAKKREIVTLDIQLAAERGLGGVDQDGNQVNVDLGWFFDQWIRGAGMPKYDFSYDVRRAEDGGYLVEGSIRQSVVIGSGKNLQTLEGQVYRGIIFVTAKAKGGAVRHRVIVNGPDTRFQFKVPNKPFEVVLNDEGEMLALDVAKK